jgi:hypothetical protein
MLTVSDGQNTSLPSYVEVRVTDDSAAAEPAPQQKKEIPPPEKTAPAPEKQSDAPPPAKNAPGGTAAKKQTPPAAAPEADNADGVLLPPPRDSVVSAEPKKSDSPAAREEKELSRLDSKADPEAEQKLIAALSNEDAEVRGAAAAALYRRGINSIPALIGVLESGEPVARKEAQWALRELTHETFGTDAAKWKKWWSQQPASKNHPVTGADK